MRLVKPGIEPPLDPGFRPAALAVREFERDARQAGGRSFVLGLERSEESRSRFETIVFPENHPREGENLFHVERLLKFLLWQRGAWKVYAGGSRKIGEYLQEEYSPTGSRAFDADFMGDKIYQLKFSIVSCPIEEVPPEIETESPLGRHMDGCRIGFDLGASDRKVSAVIDGETVFSEEVVWEPRKHSDPEYHFSEIMAALKSAAEKLPRVDAIGGSSAGVFVDNKARVASLFRGVPPERYGEVWKLFPRIAAEMGVPFVVVNDGEVTALAGSMSLDVGGVLGVALGSSEAGGYVTQDGNITDWLNELAFCPVDYRDEGPEDEWSGDRGVGVQYFSQQAVFRLSSKAGIDLPSGVPDADKLKSVQDKLESGHDGARKIWESLGVYMGYGIAHYASFYGLQHVLILGRCTSGSGGELILTGAEKVLSTEFPELAAKIQIRLPDEKSRRVGQAIAAASLPALKA